MNKSDYEHLTWIHDRLVNIHLEDYLTDYMWDLRAIRDRIKEETQTGETTGIEEPQIETERWEDEGGPVI